MNCRGVIRELSSYLDGELDRITLAEIELHLERCEDCRLVVDTTRKTIDIFCKAEPVPLPEDVRQRLHSTLLAPPSVPISVSGLWGIDCRSRLQFAECDVSAEALALSSLQHARGHSNIPCGDAD
jgi:Putative zinc-finger